MDNGSSRWQCSENSDFPGVVAEIFFHLKSHIDIDNMQKSQEKEETFFQINLKKKKNESFKKKLK